MARKRTKPKGTVAPAQTKTPADGDRDANPTPITLQQALAELDRLTPWSRSLPICKALLQAEIQRLRADNTGNSTSKCNGPVVAAARPVQAAPVGPLSRESSATDDAKDALTLHPDSTLSEAPGAPAPGAPSKDNAGVQKTFTSEVNEAKDTEAACPEHWDSEVEGSLKESAAAPELAPEGSSKEAVAAPEKACTLERDRAQLKIRIPIEEYPGYNFIGRLLGPRGATLKHLEVSSKCRLYIRGRGSLRSSDINHELAKASLPGFEHLNEDLHVLVEYEGPPEHREKCLGIASRLVAPLLVPPASDEQDELKKQQLKELAILNGTYKENKQLLPVANKRVTAAMTPSGNVGGSNNGGNWGGASNTFPTGRDLNPVNCQSGAGNPGGLNANMMMQVMAQQLFLQEHHKHAHAFSMRLGLQHAQQHAIATRQQVLAGGNNGNNAMSMPNPAPGLHAANSNGSNGPMPGHPNNINNKGVRAAAAISNTSAAFIHHNIKSNDIKSLSSERITPNAEPSAVQRTPFSAVNGTMPSNTNARGRTDQMTINHDRGHVVSVDAKPFVPPLSRQTVDAQPFVPSSRIQSQQRGRSSSSGLQQQQRSLSQGPPVQHTSSGGFGYSTFTPRKEANQYNRPTAHNENWDPQWAAGMGSPSFLTSMSSTPQDRHGTSQHDEGADAYQYKSEVLRTGSAQSLLSYNSLDDSVDKSWGAALPFDSGWEGGDADSSFNTKTAGRGSPPGARGQQQQRWHPYSRSPPKASPDFSAKVHALCTASFGSRSNDNSGSYSLF